jgi:Domain of unknown function (DUF4974)/FecR protein
MDTNTHIQQLLQKFILNKCSKIEIDDLLILLKKSKTPENFPEVEEVLLLINEKPVIQDNQSQEIYSIIQNKIAQNNKPAVKPHRKRRILQRYAAIAIIFIGIIFTNYLFNQENYKSTIQIPIGKEQLVSIVLQDGSVKYLTSLKNGLIKDIKGNSIGNKTGNKLVYNNSFSGPLAFNSLTVPAGKNFELQLSDGTAVNLNSGTTIKYPINFSNQKERNVYITGEAYFKVAKDKKHPFIVHSNKLNVQVLGTQFNVSSYPEDNVADVVLVEGSVELYISPNREASTILKPEFKASYDKQTQLISKYPVITNTYTCWISGELVFKNMTFDNILKKLERHYNIDIVNTNKELGKEEFNARFKNEPVEKILDYFKTTYGIHFIIQDNKIIIK